MEKEDKGEKSEMVAIAIQEFLSASKLPVDIYVRLSEEKYILFFAVYSISCSIWHKVRDSHFFSKSLYGLFQVTMHLTSF